MKYLQTKPQVKNMNINYYDLYFTVIKVRDENKGIDNQYENGENDYINFNDIVPNRYIVIKPRETILKLVEKNGVSNKSFQVISYYINRDAKMNSRRCEICNVDFHRASYMKHLRSKKHLENIKRNEMIIPEWLFLEPVENKYNKIHNSKSLKQITRENIRLDDKQLNKELARKMINPYYFTNRALQVAFNINLDSHYINHANSKITITPNFPEFDIKLRYINKIMKELAMVYARLISQ